MKSMKSSRCFHFMVSLATCLYCLFHLKTVDMITAMAANSHEPSPSVIATALLPVCTISLLELPHWSTQVPVS